MFSKKKKNVFDLDKYPNLGHSWNDKQLSMQ